MVCEKERLAKEMKKHYDKNANLMEFNEGALVLVRPPDLAGKLEDIWEGPYEITRRISSVTYELAVPTRWTKKRVIHINMLKAWKSPDAPVFGVKVAEEDECENDQPGHGGEELAQKQAQELQAVLQFGDVICETTGMAHNTDHGIDTGEHTPIRSVPYRLAPAWKKQLRVEVLSLLEQGIVIPSLSPWSSPMVRKPDGPVCLCIDFGKVNSITTPNLYAMPLIDDLIDQLGEAKILSKMDPNKGFYSISLKEADMPKTAFCTP